MPRTPLHPELIHQGAHAGRDGEQLARLSALAAPVARALGGAAIVREAAAAGAVAWLDDARDALRGLLRVPGALEGLDTAALTAQFAAELAPSVPAPTEAECATR